ncbi:DUF4278 domain-containing protein [Allocoleopsis franciscana]|uniref:DUF4278 domain-containing protein n=1 Tax=Allocoleopsis franciscana PCC 7113 TaxID=1173027 RepID=K9WEN5_9CYAN|nr:DUF4278 domain-containing protein [Allocoleopsis franciscana]AFZ18224.1 hypothetical protein Mic7113_2422 [Allocoleopsis franciscana PCC 7113]
MQLCYRGVSYDYNPTSVETFEGEVGGKYRGLPWRHTHLKLHKGLGIKPIFDLYYRGVTPKRKQDSQPSGIPVTEPNTAGSF